MNEFKFELNEIVDHVFFKENRLKVLQRVRIESPIGIVNKYVCCFARKRKLNGIQEFTFMESELMKGESNGL